MTIMTPETWKQIKDIVADAAGMPAGERDQFLDQHFAGDPEIREQVEALIRADNTHAELLEGGIAAALSDLSGKSREGEQVGPYRIVKILGTGGMGDVYLAERIDGAFEQKVAIKLIKRGMDSDAILRRFVNERQILASLDHPNIAHLVDGGTTSDGLPYFVLEYVEGENILEYSSRNNLDVNGRLELFRQVCSAVAYAHRNLVVHRDLKPSNVLVTRDGVPKLLDFGIAKILRANDTDAVTATQQYVFTPEYASPEQVRGEQLTTATDVYSLGIVLFELLTGKRPYATDDRSIGGIVRAVCESNPTAPSRAAAGPNTSATNLKGDLDTIILKALRKEPERRYSSVEQFSADIDRHLKNLPISAAPDTWRYRAAKFVSRNRIGVAAACLILVTLLSGLAATLYQRNKAQRRFNDVRQLANSFLFEFHDAIENLSGSTPARKLLVSRAVEYLDKLAEDAGDDPALLRELASGYERIGKIQGNSYYANLGDSDGAMKSYQRSLEIRQKLNNADPNNRELQYELARSYRGVGDMLYTIDDLKGALKAYENGVETLEKAAAAEPDNLQFLNVLADIHSRCGDVKGMEGFQNLGDTIGALESYRRSVEIAKKLIEIKPDNTEYLGDYGTRLMYFGRLQAAQGDSKGSIESGQNALAIFDKLSAEDPSNFQFKTRQMIVLNSIRIPLIEEGRTREAVDNGHRVIKTLNEMVAADPKNINLKRGLGVSYNSLGTALMHAKDFDAAIENFRRALSFAEELAAADPKSSENRRDVIFARQLLAEALLEKGETDTALGNLKQNISRLEEFAKTENAGEQYKEELALALGLAGKALSRKNELASAAEHYRRAGILIDEVTQKTSPNHRSKTRFAELFFDGGKALDGYSQKLAGENRDEVRRSSCDYFRRSFDIWTDFQKNGTLSSINAGRPEEAAKEVARCGA